MAPTSIDGNEITGATIDGQDVSEITVDGQTVFTAIPDSVVDSFEDGDVSDWINVNGTNLEAVQTSDNGASAPEGDWMSRSAMVGGSNSNNYLDISPITPTELYCVVRAENHSDSFDDFRIQWQNGGTQVITVILDATGDGAFEINGTVTSVTAVTDEFYELYLKDIDFGAETVGSFEVDGTEAASDVAFNNSASEIDRLRIDQTGNGDAEGYSDNHRYSE